VQYNNSNILIFHLFCHLILTVVFALTVSLPQFCCIRLECHTQHRQICRTS